MDLRWLRNGVFKGMALEAVGLVHCFPWMLRQYGCEKMSLGNSVWECRVFCYCGRPKWAVLCNGRNGGCVVYA